MFKAGHGRVLICAGLLAGCGGLKAAPATTAKAAATTVSEPPVRIPLTVAKGVPLRIKLTRRVPITRAGVRVEGRLAAPVYVYNREVFAAGTVALGQVTRVRSVSRMARARSIMAGDFTPWRTARVTFDALVLKNGTRVAIRTAATAGAPQMVRLVSGGAKRKSAIRRALGNARAEFRAEKQQALAQVKGPGKIHRMWKWAESVVAVRLPYHRQAYPAGTEFTAVLKRPVSLGTERIPARELAEVGSAPPPDSVVHARLTAALDSATAKQGAPVEALVTRPLYSARKKLVIPQGTRLEGAVIRAKPARWLHRDGSLRFTFQRMEAPASQPEFIPGSLRAVVVPRQANLKLSAEGGAKPKSSKTRFLMPALALSLAAVAATPDRDALKGAQAGAAVPAQGGGLGAIAAGGWGLGLIGSVAALAAQSRWVSAVLGFYSAAGAVYSNLIARGHDVEFPANTPMEIRLGNHHRPGPKLRPPAQPLPLKQG
jgi:hypothetical protein